LSLLGYILFYKADATPAVTKVVYLVSGVGVPRDAEVDGAATNSTEHVGSLMARWLQTAYPFVRVVALHSRTNVFRCDRRTTALKKIKWADPPPPPSPHRPLSPPLSHTPWLESS
jgi:hypothetical protein